ncbi:hypothetical protein BKA62DRAFT_678486 [Auriculariales sp. MPI-PUGE-AT-0066]|nr:hypothetical protein BKA62DRAFT_678486 [Auriculariales sp. MPI-PUGE-AT-0066]
MHALYDEAAETVRGMHNLHGMRDDTALEGIADFIGQAKHKAFIDPSIRLTTGQVRFNRRGKAEHHKCSVRCLRVMTIRGGSMQEAEGRIPGRIPSGTKPERDRDHQGCALSGRVEALAHYMREAMGANKCAKTKGVIVQKGIRPKTGHGRRARLSGPEGPGMGLMVGNRWQPNATERQEDHEGGAMARDAEIAGPGTTEKGNYGKIERNIVGP